MSGPLVIPPDGVPRIGAAFATLAFSPCVTVQCVGTDCRPFHLVSLRPQACPQCGQYAVITALQANYETGELVVGVARWVSSPLAVPRPVRP